jgi:teichuronic acid exporter
MNLIASPIRFALNIYLASCLLPSDYGAVVIPMVIISLSDVLIDAGFKASLIQKATLKNSHCSTIFFTNLAVSSALFLIFVVLAYPFEIFFKIQNLTLLIIFSSFSLIIRSLGMVTEARLQIKGKYGQLIFIELITYIIAYAIAIYMAKGGYGPFSLIAMLLCSELGYNFGMYMLERFVPRWHLVSKKLIMVHWRMGKSLLGQGLLETFTNKIDEIILSKFIGISRLGVFSKGREYSNTLGIIGSKFFARPWFSIMSKHSTNKEFFTRKYYMAFLALIIVSFCVISGNYYLGETFIKHVMGVQWLGLVKLFQYFIISTSIYYLVTFNKYTILALGKSQINLKIEGFYSVFRVAGLFAIFLFFNQSFYLIYILIGLDIISRFFMLIVQSYSISTVLNHNLKFFMIGFTIIVIALGIISIKLAAQYLTYSIVFVLLLIIALYNFFVLYKKSQKYSLKTNGYTPNKDE